MFFFFRARAKKRHHVTHWREQRGMDSKTSVVPMSQCYVIKQMVKAIACTIEIWMHLGGLLSTQEAVASCDSYASFVLSNLPRTPYNNYSTRTSWIWSDKITNECVARVDYNHFISNKGEWNHYFGKFSNRFCRRFLFPQFHKASGNKIFKLGALFSIWRKTPTIGS